MTAAIDMRLIADKYLQPAIGIVLAGLLATLLINAAIHGLQQQLHDQLAQMLLLVISGLALRRYAVWVVFSSLVIIVAIGGLHDAKTHLIPMPMHEAYSIPSTLLGYFIVAILIDRSAEALRESLHQSRLRAEQLQHEMLARQQVHVQLVHAQKKQITEQMASGLAHDLNNIFAVVQGLTDVSREHDEGTDKEHIARLNLALDAINETAMRGMALSRRLLRFSRPDQPVSQIIEAGEAIEETQQMLRQLLKARITLKISRAPVPLPIRFDRSQFELMLLNLAANANDAISASGIFSIDTRLSGECVEISVCDDGCGMSEAVAARIFEPFFSTKAADDGTGLGLAMVHELVSKAAGDISVESSVGHGSRFRIRLPLATDISPSV